MNQSIKGVGSFLGRLYGTGPAVEAEVARVEASGGWVSDGRVCDVLAVSRAFGDRQFKGTEGLRELVARGVECGTPPPPPPPFPPPPFSISSPILDQQEYCLLKKLITSAYTVRTDCL